MSVLPCWLQREHDAVAGPGNASSMPARCGPQHYNVRALEPDHGTASRLAWTAVSTADDELIIDPAAVEPDHRTASPVVCSRDRRPALRCSRRLSRHLLRGNACWTVDCPGPAGCSFCPLTQPLSMDIRFADLSGCLQNIQTGEQLHIARWTASLYQGGAIGLGSGRRRPGIPRTVTGAGAHTASDKATEVHGSS